MDKSAQIKLLKKQLQKVNGDSFDLEAWKVTSITLLSKIFGADDERIKAINDLKIDYGSWALRDASSKYDPVTTCKRKAQDLIELSIEELEMSTPEKTNQLQKILSNHLSGNQLNELNAITDKATLIKKLQALKAPTLAAILADLTLK
ncbi:MAG: hypothetical protein RJQ09_04050 [Cyclobacteriaceae bacterium]